MTAHTIIVPVNAETRTDAEKALRAEFRKRGVGHKVISSVFADFTTGQLPEDKVAITVTKGIHGETPARLRRTILVTVEKVAS